MSLKESGLERKEASTFGGLGFTNGVGEGGKTVVCGGRHCRDTLVER